MTCDAHGDRTAGLTLTDTETVAADHRTVLDGRPVSELHRALAGEAFTDAVVRAARDALAGMALAEARAFLEDRVTALSGHYADAVLDVARGEWSGVRNLARLTPALGSGQTPADLRSDVDDLTTSFAPLFAAADDVTPTVVVRLTKAFRTQRADQRRDVCRYLWALAEGCDVRVVGSGLDLRWLTAAHGDDLPRVDAPFNPYHPDTSPADRVADAAETIAPDGREARVLEELAAEPTGTLSYSALYGQFACADATTRGAINHLDDLGLVATYGTRTTKRVELRDAGQQYLAARSPTKTAGQRRESTCVQNDDNNPTITVYPDDKHGEGTAPTADADRDGDRHRVRDRHRAPRAAAAAVAPKDGVAALSRPVERWEDGREPRVSVDAARDEVVVAAELHTPLQFTVCLARAFTDGRIRRALSPDDVDDLLADAGAPALRLRRQLGWLPDDVDSGTGWWEELTAAREELLDLTHRLADADDPKPDLRGDILRLAHGLVGTVTHALDRAGVDVVREVRLPTYRQFDEDTRDTVAETLTHMVTIGSRYGDYALHRTVFEDREDKRRAARDPRVDPTDPYGTFIGGMTLVGPRADDLAGRVEDRLAGADPVEDAPEVAARVPVNTDPGRPAVREAVERMCDEKGLTATRAATSVIDAVLQDPYTATEALAALERADCRRAIRLDEVRYALAHVPEDRLLPSVSAPSARAMLAALLRAETALTPAEVADAADVSERSVARHADALTALDVVRETDDGLRVALPHRNGDERGETILPAAVREDSVATGVTALDDLALAVSASTPVGDPATRLTAYREDDAVAGWVPVALALGAATIEADPPDRDPRTVTVGPTPRQTSLTDAEVVV